MTTTFARRFARTLGAAALLAIAILGAACIQKDTRSVMYLEPGGSVTWSILETDVRSDAATPDERATEERNYRQQMHANPAPLSVLLDTLGGRSITRTVLKDTAPFEVHTAAGFDRLDVLLESVCKAAGLECVSRLTWEGPRQRLTLEQVGKIDGTAEAQALGEILDGLKLVLSEGKFVEATGFTLKDDRTATLKDDLDEDHLVLSLTWEK